MLACNLRLVLLTIVKIGEMLRLSKELAALRSKHARFRSVHLPRIHWQKWLYSGGQEEESLSPNERLGISDHKLDRSKDDKDSAASSLNLLDEAHFDRGSDFNNKERARQSAPAGVHPALSQSSDAPGWRNLRKSLIGNTRGPLADALEWAQHSEDLSYAFRLTIATYLVTFPAVVPSLNAFYSHDRGTWAALQLMVNRDKHQPLSMC